MQEEIRHRKNAAEWIMWFCLLPLFAACWIREKLNYHRGTENTEKN
jgi:hypothetical protein